MVYKLSHLKATAETMTDLSNALTARILKKEGKQRSSLMGKGDLGKQRVSR